MVQEESAFGIRHSDRTETHPKIHQAWRGEIYTMEGLWKSSNIPVDSSEFLPLAHATRRMDRASPWENYTSLDANSQYGVTGAMR
jgi:hypothetical protein